MLKERGRVLVVISEGFDVGDIAARKDSFGHTMFGASGTTVEQMVVNYLNEVGLAALGSARGNVPGTDQRHNMIYASTVDMEEAYKVGQKAVLIAAEEGSGFMSTLLRAGPSVRTPGDIYTVVYDKVPLEQVANSERTFPAEWITPDGTDVTDAFVRYARPLIGDGWPSIPLVDGRQRFSRIAPLMAEQRLPAYVPQAYRA
jgi:hypothetical protein